MDHFTLDDLAAFSKEEDHNMGMLKAESPSEASVGNILAYMKSVSFRKSSGKLKTLQMHLN
jgi:hypothetical protein